ncbi:MMPL family transporter [Actinotalea fermentans]|uniref:MMPL family transporter n=1 Tax=Actinotalea fermentans TaxID=43671 RepID=UPI0011BDC09E|nr:MMPL family transporter [Actinotalea fermentans]
MLRNRRGRGVLRGAGLVALILVWLALAGMGGQSVGKLSEVQENDVAAFLPQSAESTRAAELDQGFTDDSVLPALVVVEADGGGALTEQQIGAVQGWAAQLPTLDVGEGETIADLLVADPVAIPSQDGEAVLVTLSLDSVRASEQIGEERVVNLVVAAVRDAATPLEDAGLVSWVTGPAGSIADLVEAFGGIDGLLLLVALAVVFVILILVYRSPSLPFTVLFTALFGLSAAALVVYQLAKAGVLVLNGQSQGILFILVVGAATDYSLLIVARYREELRRVESPYTAMSRALRASFEPIAASAGTVIAGLLTLLLSDLKSNSSLGPVAAIGIAAAMLAAMTLLPALLLAAGKRARFIFWPRMPHPVPVDEQGRPQDETLAHLEDRTGVWGRVSKLVGRRPRLVWAGTAVVLLAAAAWVPTLDASGTSDSDIFLTEVESVTGGEALAEHFDAGQVEPIQIFAPEDAAADVVAAVEGVDGITSATVFTGAPGAPGAPSEAPPLVVDGLVRIDAVTQASAESQEASDVVADVRDAVHAVDGSALVGGAAAQRLDTQETNARDLTVIVPAILLVILIVLILLLRSVVAPLLIVAANVLSFAATIGLGALAFNHVFGFPGTDASVPLYAFVFLVALGIDYSIFLMTRVREESLVHGTRLGVRRGLTVTGGVITSAGLVLAATFGALAVLPLLFLVQLAFLVALGVLVDTFIVRTLLVPGLVHDVGRRVWWPWEGRVPADDTADGDAGRQAGAAPAVERA